MDALPKAAIGCAILAALSLRFAGSASDTTGPAPRSGGSVIIGTAAPASSVVELRPMPCPPRHLPEGEACIPLPALDEPLREGIPLVGEQKPARGQGVEILPRRPDRSANAEAFVYPIEGEPLFLRGPDEPRPADESPVAVQLATERGTPVIGIELDGQTEPARVVAVGRLIGNTVVTSHLVEADGRLRLILLVHGRLEAIGPDITVGASAERGRVLGYAGDSGSPGIVSLYLEARQMREEIVPDGLTIKKMVDAGASIPTDIRNVLALRD